MRPAVTFLIAPLVATAVLLAGTGCEPNTDSGRAAHCSVIADPPERNSLDNPDHIVGTARFWCDPPGADRLTVTIRLQKQNAEGRWVDASHKTFGAKLGQTTRPKSEDERDRGRSVYTACTEGDFRTVVTGSYTSRGVSKDFDSTSAPSHHPCRGALFS